jgi:hypothetical protein
MSMPGEKSPKDRLPVFKVWADPRTESGPLIYSAPEPEPPPKPAVEKPPQDYIMCLNRHPRLVAACMKNCWLPHYCDRFHRFFADRGQTPIQYYNRDGIGAQAMRRIVFDCDRCGRKDIDPVFSRYSREGQTEEFLLGDADRATLVDQAGYRYEDLGDTIFSLLANIEQAKGWYHFCDRCFGNIADSLAKIMNVSKTRSEKLEPSVEVEAPIEAPRKLKKVAAAGG